jgi:hypothetical protein
MEEAEADAGAPPAKRPRVGGWKDEAEAEGAAPAAAAAEEEAQAAAAEEAEEGAEVEEEGGASPLRLRRFRPVAPLPTPTAFELRLAAAAPPARLPGDDRFAAGARVAPKLPTSPPRHATPNPLTPLRAPRPRAARHPGGFTLDDGALCAAAGVPPPSFVLILRADGFALVPPPRPTASVHASAHASAPPPLLLHPYDRSTRELLADIESGRLPAGGASRAKQRTNNTRSHAHAQLPCAR